MSTLRFCFLMVIAMASAESAEVRGRVVDATQGSLANALVRLIPSGESFAKFRSMTDLKGEFAFTGIPAGTYTMRAGRQAFRERTISGLELQPGEWKELGAIRLELAGCDAPEVICDSCGIGASEPNLPVAHGYIVLQGSSGVDLDTGAVFRTDQMSAARPQPGSDVSISFDAGSGRIIPVNGALLQADCSSGKFEEVPIRLDGLGPGAEFCVQTNRHHYSHLFIMDEIRPETSSIRLWHVTRKP